jgi:hypothetical protein
MLCSQDILPDIILDPYYSDAAMSRYLEESGGCLTELMLNNVEKVLSSFCFLECDNRKSYSWDITPLILLRCRSFILFPCFEQ